MERARSYGSNPYVSPMLLAIPPFLRKSIVLRWSGCRGSIRLVKLVSTLLARASQLSPKAKKRQKTKNIKKPQDLYIPYIFPIYIYSPWRSSIDMSEERGGIASQRREVGLPEEGFMRIYDDLWQFMTIYDRLWPTYMVLRKKQEKRVLIFFRVRFSKNKSLKQLPRRRVLV